MALLLKIVIGLVVLLVIAVAALRIRKLRRDELRELTRPVDPRLMAPPPSPYEPSKGFRLLDGPIDNETHRPQPPRPRLESDREYVFSESQMGTEAEVVPMRFRHNEKWALSKSARRSTSFTGLRVAVIAAIVVVIVGAVGLYVQHRDAKNGSTTTTTTTTTRPSTTTTASAFQTSVVVTFGDTVTHRVHVRMTSSR